MHRLLSESTSTRASLGERHQRTLVDANPEDATRPVLENGVRALVQPSRIRQLAQVVENQCDVEIAAPGVSTKLNDSLVADGEVFDFSIAPGLRLP